VKPVTLDDAAVVPFLVNSCINPLIIIPALPQKLRKLNQLHGNNTCSKVPYMLFAKAIPQHLLQRL
jgi:hypothetical protein